ncbi:hypothetical protein LVJ82_15595 [Vitreoscilla massiliensis]|uniref:Uncharacterized protein n=1 Tax=Vitreoscilla massiliensis TaxID=1689272 RepID=A0ABY4DZD6_9NEIS|nr:hypothetical protein [Vitreoscilla massiliensis]UOO88861.1 hypothetical protein LVJ82_15595 [Vitreoscilla massiliensis]
MKALDHTSALLQYSPTNLNQLVRFGSLNSNGRQNAAFNRGFFTSVIPALMPSFYGDKRQGRIRARWVRYSSLPTLLSCCHPTTFGSVLVAVKTVTKGIFMAKIRKGYSRPLYIHNIRNFPTLEAASRHVDLMLRGNALARFNIQQTAQGWSVGRVCA